MSSAEISRISKEFVAAYRPALRRQCFADTGTLLMIWLVPGLFLYTLGYAIGWMRRGFRPRQQ
jgi:hypothetical protein